MAGIIEGLQGLLGSLLGEDAQNFRPQIPTEDPPAVIQQVERNEPTIAPPGIIEEVEAETQNLGEPIELLGIENFPEFSDKEENVVDARSSREEEMSSAWDARLLSKYSNKSTKGVPVDPDEDYSKLYTEVQEYENPMIDGEAGWDAGSKTFMPFDSIEGVGKGSTASSQEIGFGMKIQKEWLSDNPDNWPTIGGIKTDVREGISLKQARLWSKETLDASRQEASTTIPDFDKMTSGAQSAWVDLFYNGGLGAWNGNPQAKAATQKGFVTEGVFHLVNYISGGKKGSKKKFRGLLNRRINAYNKVAKQSGDPQIVSYVWGPEISIELDGEISSDNWSEKLASKINKNGGKWVIAKNNKQATGETFNISGGKFGG